MRVFPSATRGIFWALAALSLCYLSASTQVLRLHGRSHKFLMASFSKLKQINYIRLPSSTWRPLVLAGLGKPEAICVDAERKRLFVVDAFSATIVWYQIKVLPSGKLMTDGHQHLLMQAVVARGLSTDATGALYIAGRRDLPLPMLPVEGIFKLDALAIAVSASGGALTEPLQVWGTDNTASAGAPDSPRLAEPAGIAVDPVNIYWGNSVEPDSVTGGVVRAGVAPPAASPEESLAVLTSGGKGVACMALTPTDVWYATPDGSVFGVAKGSSSSNCGGSAAETAGSGDASAAATGCATVSLQEPGQPLEPKAMVFDGEGTVFLSDSKTGAVYSFTSGSLSTHLLTKVADSADVWGLAVLSPPLSSAASGRSPLRALSVAAPGLALALFFYFFHL